MIDEITEGTFYALVGVNPKKLKESYREDSFKDLYDKNNAKGAFRVFPQEDKSFTIG